MEALDHDSEKTLAQARVLFSQLVPDELMIDEGRTQSERLTQMLTDLSNWADLFTICPHCNEVLLVCPWCDALFSDYKRFQAHGHECPGVAK